MLQGKLVPVIIKLKNTYGMWQEYVKHFPKSNRYTLGSKIDEVFLNAIEYTFLASYASKIEKLSLVDRAISRTDLIKLLLMLAWEIKALDTNKYTQISLELDEIGKMLGGWKKQIEQKTSHYFSEKKNE
jgi:hypothetical protein